MVGDKVKAILSATGKRNRDLAELYGISKQSLSNKLTHNRFSADDLIRIAEFAGCRLGFTLPGGGTLFLDPEDVRKPETP